MSVLFLHRKYNQQFRAARFFATLQNILSCGSLCYYPPYGYLCLLIKQDRIMEPTVITDIVGYGAAIAMVLGYLPQAIHTIRTRETDSIAMPTFLLMGLGGILFMIQGLLTDNLPLVITNLITSACSIIVTCIKINNDIIKKRKK